MSEVAEIPKADELSSLSDQIDAISTRLILDGCGSLGAVDFQLLSEDAARVGKTQFATAAAKLTDCFAQADMPVAKLTGLISCGLVELRKLLEAAPATNVLQSPAEPAAEAPASQPTPAQSNVFAEDEEMIREFITESGEHLSNIESQMLLLEKDNAAHESLNAVFRGFHTIKGLAGFLEFAPIQSLAHEVETLLDRARNLQLTVTPAVVDVVLESTDVVRQELRDIEMKLAGKTPPPTHVNEALLQRIRDVASGGTNKAGVEGKAPADVAAAILPKELPAASAPSAEIAVATELKAPLEVARQQTGVPAQPAPARAIVDAGKPQDAASVRIDTAKLDQLMDMVGEMVIAQTLIGHSPVVAAMKDARLLRDLSQLARITTDVQRITTSMRMVPIGLQFQKTARVIRDLSRRAGKQIVLETTGEDTELDKTIAEELADPLLHMVRNSIDHGIEPPEERVALGKDATAHIRISAYHQSGQIVIAISDDGRGLNREKILAKAQQNGLIQNGAQLTDNEIFLLIFEPGFSTAEKVTDISGRGVGMDVVRRHVQKLRGRIEIQSHAGQGTTFFLKLPLTLAIIEGLVVGVGNQRYIVPIFLVKEMFRPTAEMLSTVQAKGEMATVRGGLMPVVRLHRRFEIEPVSENLTEGVLVVAESRGKQFCLFVDTLIGKQEVVIKSLGESFKNISGIAGCAILGDGRVGLILDVDSIYKGRS